MYVYVCAMFEYEHSGIITAPTTHSGKWRQWQVSCLFTAYMIFLSISKYALLGSIETRWKHLTNLHGALSIRS